MCEEQWYEHKLTYWYVGSSLNITNIKWFSPIVVKENDQFKKTTINAIKKTIMWIKLNIDKELKNKGFH